MALSTSATESLLRAVDIIATSKIGETSYDQTIICTIVDNSEVEKRGFYTVTDGKVRFKAYTDVTTYQVGDQIRVTIPNGDFNAKKYIDGAYSADDDSSAPITYVSPLDSFLSMADLIESTENISGALKANELNIQNPNGIPIWTKTLTDSSTMDLQYNGIYDAIGLSADFKCLLGKYDMKSGNYGLRLDTKVKVNKTENYIVKSFYLDSSEMFGNPYNFIAPSTQEKMFDIVSVGTIVEMTLYFYQNNNFIYKDVNDSSLQDIAVGEEYNIFVNNIQISFGTNILDVEDNTLKAYTLSSSDFNYVNPTDQTNLKRLSLLWYNKNDLNQYLGFSDGIADVDNTQTVVPYDEIEYLKESKRSTRLVSQMGKANVPSDVAGLELSALTEEAFVLIEEIKTLINEDLVNTLKNYQSKFKTRLPEALVIIDDSYLAPLQNGEKSYIKVFEEELKTKQEYLIDMLAHVAKIQRVQNSTDYWDTSELEERPKTEQPILLELIQNQLDALLVIHNDVLSKFKNLVSSEEYQNFKGSYDSFAKSIGDIIALITNKVTLIKEDKAVITDTQEDESGNIKEEKTPLEDALMWYTGGYRVAPYIPPEEEDHINRYCIYWYRYLPGYINPNVEFDFAGPEWERIVPEETKIQTSSDSTPESLQTIPKNLGLPTTFTRKDNIYYWDKKPAKNEGMLNIYLEPKMHQEKFKVILFYNHDKYESEPIVFTNVNDIVSIEADKTNALSIQHITNSSDTYQTEYSVNNFLTNRANAKKNRGVQAIYNGVLGTSEEVLVDSENPAHIYWYVPIENTMINIDLDYLKEQGFVTDYVPTYKFTHESILTRLQQWYNWCKNNGKRMEFFHDKPYVMKNPSEPTFGFKEEFDLKSAFKGFKKVGNFISLREDFSMQEFSDDEDKCGKWLPFTMKFPKFDSDGNIITDDNNNIVREDEEETIIEEVVDEKYHRDGYAYFYKLIEDIEDTKFFYQIKSYFTSNEANNQIFCLVEKNNETFEASLNITFGTQGALGADYSFIIDPADRQSAVRSDKALQVDIALFDYDNKQIPIYEYDVANKEPGSAYLVKTNGTEAEEVYISWIGDAYKFNLKEDEANTVIGGEISFESGKEYKNIGSILALTASFNNNNGDEESNSTGSDYKKKKLSNITTFYSVPYASADFYIEGATSVIYDSNGNNPDYYKKPYRIFYNYSEDNSEEKIGVEVTDVKWRIVYYSYDGTTFSLTNNTEFCENYLPVLNDKNILTPCTTYVDDGDAEIDYYAFIQCFNTPTDAPEQIIWSQPIIVRKNRYAANMKNSYDSSLAINLNSGTIISSLMNAFRRSGTSSTSLEGFVVGEMQYQTSESGQTVDKNKLGLFGFRDGLETFAFNVDGSMSLGVPGSGQLTFDGANGLISSASNATGGNEAGMKINLQDGTIDIYSSLKQAAKKVTSSGPFATSMSLPSYVKPGSSNKVYTNRVFLNGASATTSGYVQPDTSAGKVPSWWPKFGSGWGSQVSTAATSSNSSYGGETSNTEENPTSLFLIQVPNKNNDGRNNLIAIGDEECVIQSNNYKGGEYGWADSNTDPNGATGNDEAEGMKIDLQFGFIDAYKLKISSNNILINSSGDSDPLFVVRTKKEKDSNQYKNLLYVKDQDDGTTDFYIQSANYQEKIEGENGQAGSGLKFDVKKGTIESYNFSLRGETSADDDNQYAGSYIHITSNNEEGEPALRFHLKNNQAVSEEIKANGIDLLHITPTIFVLHSTDYDPTAGTGLELDIGNGRIESYNFSLKGQATDNTYGGSYIWITSDTEPDNESAGMPKIEFKLIKNSDDTKIDMSLLSISPDEFFLISPNFDSGDGIKLDILSGTLGIRKKIENEIIDLMSVSTESFKLTSPGFATGSGMELDIVNGSMNIKNNNQSLLEISSTVFTMQSPDWSEGASGTKMDLIDGSIIMHQKDTNQKLIINAKANNFPLQIGPVYNSETGDLKFRVHWDGTIYVGKQSLNIGLQDDGSLEVQGGTTATYISSNSYVNATTYITAGDYIEGKEIISKGALKGTSLVITDNNNNTQASINNSGVLTVKSATISGSTTVTGKLSIKNSSNTETASITQAGALTATSATLKSTSASTNVLTIQNGSTQTAGITAGGTIRGTALNIANTSGTIQATITNTGALEAKSITTETLTLNKGFIASIKIVPNTNSSYATTLNCFSGTNKNVSLSPIPAKTVTIKDAEGNSYYVVALTQDTSYTYLYAGN